MRVMLKSAKNAAWSAKMVMLRRIKNTSWTSVAFEQAVALDVGESLLTILHQRLNRLSVHCPVQPQPPGQPASRLPLVCKVSSEERREDDRPV